PGVPARTAATAAPPRLFPARTAAPPVQPANGPAPQPGVPDPPARAARSGVALPAGLHRRGPTRIPPETVHAVCRPVLSAVLLRSALPVSSGESAGGRL